MSFSEILNWIGTAATDTGSWLSTAVKDVGSTITDQFKPTVDWKVDPTSDAAHPQMVPTEGPSPFSQFMQQIGKDDNPLSIKKIGMKNIHFGGGKIEKPRPARDDLIKKGKVRYYSGPGLEQVSSISLTDEQKAAAFKKPGEWIEGYTKGKRDRAEIEEWERKNRLASEDMMRAERQSLESYNVPGAPVELEEEEEPEYSFSNYFMD